MVGSTQAEQPLWITPFVTVTPRLKQEFRYDMSRQVQPNGTAALENYGSSKSLELIPARHIELIFNPSPYIVRSFNGVPDSYGDVSFRPAPTLMAPRTRPLGRLCGWKGLG